MKNLWFLLVISLVGSLICLNSVFSQGEFATSTEEYIEISATSTEEEYIEISATSTEIEEDIEVFGPVGEESGYSLLLENGGCGTIICDDFNSYDDGDLNGQGPWVGDAVVDIQGTIVMEGAKAVVMSGEGGVSGFGNQVADGRITGYVRAVDSSATALYFQLYEGASYRVGVRFFQGVIAYLSPGLNWETIASELANDTWHIIEIEWRSADKYARYRVNEVSWTNWLATYSSFSSYLDKVRMYGGGASLSYFDYIAENPYLPPVPGVAWGEITGTLSDQEDLQTALDNLSMDQYFQLIQNATTGAEFYLEKTLSYGDLMIIFFFTLILLWTIGEKIFKFFWR